MSLRTTPQGSSFGVPVPLALAVASGGLAWLFVRSVGVYHQHVQRGRDGLQGGPRQVGTPMSWEEFRWRQADEGLPYSK